MYSYSTLIFANLTLLVLKISGLILKLAFNIYLTLTHFTKLKEVLRTHMRHSSSVLYAVLKKQV